MPELLDLTGYRVLVTGASGGIGAGIARRFAAAGAELALQYHRGAEAAQRLAGELGGRTLTVAVDLTDPTACAQLVATAAEHLGGLDVLVNCAGVQPVASLPDLDAPSWRAVIEANLTSVFACTQAAARVIAEQGGGSITHIASIEGSHPAFGHAHYSTAKAAVIMHARAAALEYGPRGVRVNTVSPGLIDRDGLAEQWPDGVARWQRACPLGRLGTPEDIGNACVFLASPLASWITGHDLVVDGGTSQHPTW
jgi:NAD(P)-dependent dehydrogenase (short-subunit alcohol dehydrogenase family)